MAVNFDLTRAEVLNAVKNHELRLYYQPLYDFRTKRFVSVEALVRWEHPVHGLILPDTFLPMVEKFGVGVKLGDWVLKSACHQFQAWKSVGIQLDRIAVNVTGRQLHQKTFVDDVMSILTYNHMKPYELEFELTEEIIIHDGDDRIAQVVRRLKNLGVHIALDDFGTGYSSISYLRKIPIDRIKIDRSYIKNMLLRSSDEAIVQAIIALAKGMSLRVVAEGVESYPQLILLLMHEGLEAQGYYFSKAISAEEAETFLKHYQEHPFPLIS